MKKSILILSVLSSAIFAQGAFAEEAALNSCVSWRELKTCQIEIGKKQNIVNAKATDTNAAEIGAKIKDGAFIGMYILDVPASGFYNVKISAKSWVDLFQDGEKRKSKGSNMMNDGVWFKSVRFELETRKATILLSGDIPQNAVIEVTKE